MRANTESLAERPQPMLPIRYDGDSKAERPQLAQRAFDLRKQREMLRAENAPELNAVSVGERGVSLHTQPSEQRAGDSVSEPAKVGGAQRGRELVSMRGEYIVEGCMLPWRRRPPLRSEVFHDEGSAPAAESVVGEGVEEVEADGCDVGRRRHECVVQGGMPNGILAENLVGHLTRRS